eukprot:TRINITY_DN6644_c0_g1_i1.p1 TRINITY_DN6644_c0_g1~~TRINITY_DN6644_c0_g1_i1.p1  ORF type:complete len:210 (+),score=65.77 TRINITY_DN6644_c0_g1_i1:67-696(+)
MAADAEGPSAHAGGDEGPRGEGVAGELAYLFVLREAQALTPEEEALAKELALQGHYPAAKIVRLFLTYKGGGLSDAEFTAAKLAYLEGRPIPEEYLRNPPCAAAAPAPAAPASPAPAAPASPVAAAVVNGVSVRVVPDGPLYRIEELDPTDTVGDLKDRVCDLSGAQPSQIRLVFAGKELEDRRTIHDYGIVPGDGVVVNCILRLQTAQ